MYISRIYIKNYRNFKNFDLFIRNGEPLTIIGGNNSGKTNLLKAIRLVLDSQMKPWEKQLTESDFSWSLGEEPWKNGEEIVLTITLSAINPGEESNEFIQALTGIEKDGDEKKFKANISYVFAPEFKKKSSYNIHEDYRSFLVTGKYHPSGYEYDLDGKKVEYSSEFQNSFKDIVKADYSDFYKFFYLEASNLDEIKVADQTSDGIPVKIYRQVFAGNIKRRINLLFLDALRDVNRNFYEGYNSIVSQLIRYKIDLDSKKDSEFYSELSEGFTKFRNNKLKDDSSNEVIPNSAKILDETESSLKDKDLNLLSDKVNLKIGTPPINSNNISKYFNFLSDILEENKDNVSIEELGLGYQNLAYISSIFAIFELKKRINNGDEGDDNKIFFNLLLTEEPEAHLDVQNQKHLHTQIENKTKQLQMSVDEDSTEKPSNTFTQVIQTSHSTHLTAKSNLENIVVLEKNLDATKAINIDKALSNDDQKIYQHNRRIIHQYLDATRSALLFARKVILVEGSSEKFSIPTLLNFFLVDKNKTADELGVEIVEIGFKGFDSFYSLFGKDGNKLSNKCLGIVDGDWHLAQDTSTKFELPAYKNTVIMGQNNIVERKNIYTFELDTFILPDPQNLDTNNIEWLISILERFQAEGKYYENDDTFNGKKEYIRSFHETIKMKKLNNEKDDPASLKKFFSEILHGEVTKPTISLYLASLIKAKHLKDEKEKSSWPEQVLNELNPFVLPTFLKDGFTWVIE